MKSHGEASPEHLLIAAGEVKKLCDTYGLTMIGLQPFLFYEGLTDRNEHARKIEKLKLWFRIVKLLGTDIIQIPTNFLTENVTGDMDLIVQDMVEIVDLGLQENPPVRFVYEILAWGTYIDTWDQMWEVAKRVGRPNIGCCVDMFNIAGRAWADPASITGTTPNTTSDLKESIERLVRMVDVQKVFYIQAVDAKRILSPLTEGHPFHVEDGQHVCPGAEMCDFSYTSKKGPDIPLSSMLLAQF